MSTTFKALASLADSSYTEFRKAEQAGMEPRELEQLARKAARAHDDTYKAGLAERVHQDSLGSWADVATKLRRLANQYRNA